MKKIISFILLAASASSTLLLAQSAKITSDDSNSNLSQYSNINKYQPQLMMDPLAIDKSAEALNKVLRGTERGAATTERIIEGQEVEEVSSARAGRNYIGSAISSNSSSNQVLRLRGGGPKKIQPSEEFKSTGDVNGEEIIPVLEKEICNNIYLTCLAKVAEMSLSQYLSQRGILEISQEERDWNTVQHQAEEKEREFINALEQAKKIIEMAQAKATNFQTFVRGVYIHEQSYRDQANRDLELAKLTEEFAKAQVETAHAFLNAIKARNFNQEGQKEVKTKLHQAVKTEQEARENLETEKAKYSNVQNLSSLSSAKQGQFSPNTSIKASVENESSSSSSSSLPITSQSQHLLTPSQFSVEDNPLINTDKVIEREQVQTNSLSVVPVKEATLVENKKPAIETLSIQIGEPVQKNSINSLRRFASASNRKRNFSADGKMNIISASETWYDKKIPIDSDSIWEENKSARQGKTLLDILQKTWFDEEIELAEKAYKDIEEEFSKGSKQLEEVQEACRSLDQTIQEQETNKANAKSRPLRERYQAELEKLQEKKNLVGPQLQKSKEAANLLKNKIENAFKAVQKTRIVRRDAIIITYPQFNQVTKDLVGEIQELKAKFNRDQEIFEAVFELEAKPFYVKAVQNAKTAEDARKKVKTILDLDKQRTSISLGSELEQYDKVIKQALEVEKSFDQILEVYQRGQDIIVEARDIIASEEFKKSWQKKLGELAQVKAEWTSKVTDWKEEKNEIEKAFEITKEQEAQAASEKSAIEQREALLKSEVESLYIKATQNASTAENARKKAQTIRDLGLGQKTSLFLDSVFKPWNDVIQKAQTVELAFTQTLEVYQRGQNTTVSEKFKKTWEEKFREIEQIKEQWTSKITDWKNEKEEIEIALQAAREQEMKAEANRIEEAQLALKEKRDFFQGRLGKLTVEIATSCSQEKSYLNKGQQSLRDEIEQVLPKIDQNIEQLLARESTAVIEAKLLLTQLEQLIQRDRQLQENAHLLEKLDEKKKLLQQRIDGLKVNIASSQSSQDKGKKILFQCQQKLLNGYQQVQPSIEEVVKQFLSEDKENSKKAETLLAQIKQLEQQEEIFQHNTPILLELEQKRAALQSRTEVVKSEINSADLSKINPVLFIKWDRTILLEAIKVAIDHLTEHITQLINGVYYTPGLEEVQKEVQAQDARDITAAEKALKERQEIESKEATIRVQIEELKQSSLKSKAIKDASSNSDEQWGLEQSIDRFNESVEYLDNAIRAIVPEVFVLWQEAAARSKESAEHYIASAQAWSKGTKSEARNLDSEGDLLLVQARHAKYLAKANESEASEKRELAEEWHAIERINQQAVNPLKQAVRAHIEGKEDESICWYNAGLGFYSAAVQREKAFESKPEESGKYREIASLNIQGGEYFIKAITAYTKGNTREGFSWSHAGLGLLRAAVQKERIIGPGASSKTLIVRNDWINAAQKNIESSENFVNATESYALVESANSYNHQGLHVLEEAKQLAKTVEEKDGSRKTKILDFQRSPLAPEGKVSIEKEKIGKNNKNEERGITNAESQAAKELNEAIEIANVAWSNAIEAGHQADEAKKIADRTKTKNAYKEANCFSQDAVKAWSKAADTKGVVLSKTTEVNNKSSLNSAVQAAISKKDKYDFMAKEYPQNFEEAENSKRIQREAISKKEEAIKGAQAARAKVTKATKDAQEATAKVKEVTESAKNARSQEVKATEDAQQARVQAQKDSKMAEDAEKAKNSSWSWSTDYKNTKTDEANALKTSAALELFNAEDLERTAASKRAEADALERTIALKSAEADALERTVALKRAEAESWEAKVEFWTKISTMPSFQTSSYFEKSLESLAQGNRERASFWMNVAEVKVLATKPCELRSDDLHAKKDRANEIMTIIRNKIWPTVEQSMKIFNEHPSEAKMLSVREVTAAYAAATSYAYAVASAYVFTYAEANPYAYAFAYAATYADAYASASNYAYANAFISAAAADYAYSAANAFINAYASINAYAYASATSAVFAASATGVLETARATEISEAILEASTSVAAVAKKCNGYSTFDTNCDWPVHAAREIAEFARAVEKFKTGKETSSGGPLRQWKVRMETAFAQAKAANSENAWQAAELAAREASNICQNIQGISLEEAVLQKTFWEEKANFAEVKALEKSIFDSRQTEKGKMNAAMKMIHERLGSPISNTMKEFMSNPSDITMAAIHNSYISTMSAAEAEEAVEAAKIFAKASTDTAELGRKYRISNATQENVDWSKILTNDIVKFACAVADFKKKQGIAKK